MAIFGGQSTESLQALSERVSALEARCQAFAEQLADREAELKQLRLDHVVLSKRLDQTADQSAKAATALVERLQTIRGGTAASASASAASRG